MINPHIDSYSCDSSYSSCTIENAYSQSKINSNSVSYICAWWQNTCTSNNDYLQVKMSSKKYYFCWGKELNCSNLNDLFFIEYSSSSYHLCDWDEISCNSTNDILELKPSNNYYYICNWKDVCGSSKAIIQVKTENDKYFSCAWNKYICNNQNSYAKTISTSSSSNTEAFSLEDFDFEIDNNTYPDRDNSNNTTSNQSNWDTSSSTNTSNYSWYPQEYKDAYAFAYQNKITTMPTIEEAKMNDEIIRAEIAKMLANWVKSLGRTPDTSKSCNFKDISWVKGDLYTAIIESCQLGIMWQWITDFRPFDRITKWEVSTAVSRIIWGNKYNWWEPFYSKHMDALKDIWVLKDIYNPNTNELRWNVMVMLMRASSTDELADCEDPAVLLACSLWDPSCPARCLEEDTKTEVDDEVDIDALVEDILKEAEEFDNYAVSINKKIQELNDKDIAFDKIFGQESMSPEELATEENLEEIKKFVKISESIKSELQKIWWWKWDNSLINIAIEYAELHLLMFSNFYDLQECLVLSQKYIDNWENYKINELSDKMESALEGAKTANGKIEGKYEEYKKVYNDSKKKYGSSN